ncbi:hypothetical protein CBS147325_9070 [Penicillium roqueforti]|nr:hypothetical protein CBS147325_9070 [Penicillium roqueforti]KAI3153386.1 hypothetical protein DTO046C5_8734 [Penicillium roqueforti]KAI3224887.1 hypothetical protein CBS147310_8880 [Penicillium roqueforti]KAI3236973.1 hypothetical protein DTO012A9_6940 [Penicillium roqueforti]
MLRTSLRSVSGPLSRHVCLSCLPRPGALGLRQFHRISALRTNSGEIEPKTDSIDASTEPSVPLAPNGQIQDTKDAASSKPQKPAPLQPKPRELTALIWYGMSATQKSNYKQRHYPAFREFQQSLIAGRDLSFWAAYKLELRRARAAQREAATSGAVSIEAALVEADKVKALRTADIHAKRQERRAKAKERKRLANAKITTDGPADTPALSEPSKSTLDLKSTSNVVAQILDASSKNGIASSNEPTPTQKADKPAPRQKVDIPAPTPWSDRPEFRDNDEVLDFIKNHVMSKDCGSVDSTEQSLKEVRVSVPPVPRVAFGLDRVLFNPGVYQLRDPRSLVFNFDPYLDQIMPVTEFDFSALKPYITSSQDETACEITKKNKKKYYGSSSSMTSVLAHFHYLLSAWRPVDTSKISRGFDDPLRTFTRLLRAPTAMFLRYKEEEDIYAIDADKEYDHANILMNLGKSMEKQLTMPKDQFERYRRSDANKITAEEEANTPESYHYSTLGKFLMRSQLDAYDPRLPGTGMFDLKTRAVVSIRMESTEHERGMGYEIRRRYGKWESYEREYFDMIRAAFLKYSLQVRVGRMDGIFVAYHNIERIFGFQYIPLDEMDQALHGTPNTCLGDKEFELSLGLWEKILDKATKKFPKKSLRFHFEAREGNPPYMLIVAQPVTDEQIEAIQTKNKAHIDAIQDRILNPDQYIDGHIPETAVEADEDEPLYPEEESVEKDFLFPGEESLEPEPTYSEVDSTESNLQDAPPVESLADELFPKEAGEEESDAKAEEAEAEALEYKPLFELPAEPKRPKPTKSVPRRTPPHIGDFDEDILGMTLIVNNKVNGVPVQRPTWFTASDRWTIDYELNELSVEESNHILAAIKHRRNVALKKNVQDHDAGFFAILKKITEKGRVWRKKMDQKDRERGLLVYKDSCDM